MRTMQGNDGRNVVKAIERARRERGIPIAELARRIGVDRKRLWRVLNMERRMRVEEFLALCVALRIDPAPSSPGSWSGRWRKGPS